MEFRRAWQRKLYEAGYLGMDWPTEWGGRGATEVEKSIFEEELARADAPPILNILGIGLLGPALIHHGSEEQRRRFIPPMLAGDEIWCQGFSEPGAGSDLASLKTSARARRRPLRAERPEGLDDVRAVGRLDLRPRAHRLEGPLRRHLVHPLQARHARRHRAAAPADHRRERVRRGVLRGRARAARESRRPDRRGLAHRDDRARLRARRHRRSPTPSRYGARPRSCSPTPARSTAAPSAACARSSRASWSRTRSCAPTASARSPTSPTARSPGPESSIEKIFWSEFDKRFRETALDLLGPGGQLLRTSPRRARRRRLGARVPLVARRHDLLRLVRGPAQHHRQARAQPAAGLRR